MRATKLSFKNVGTKQFELQNSQVVTEVPIGIKTPLELGVTGNGLLVMHTNVVNQIDDNLRNLILTNWGERLGKYNFGANIRPLLPDYSHKETFDQEVMLRINTAITRWMPFITPENYSSEILHEEKLPTAKIRIILEYSISRLNVYNRNLEIILFTMWDFMAFNSKKDILKAIKQRKYLNKDFEGFRNDLYEYAKIHFPEQIQDFSDPSVGGMFLDLAAYVGDVQSFYLDHQFHELDPQNATELINIQRHIENAGIEITGASPAVVTLELTIQVPALLTQSPSIIDSTSLPVIKAGSTFKSNNGTTFELLEDVDFSEEENGDYTADIRIGTKDANNNILSFIMTRRELAISGNREIESFSVGTFEKFKKHTLSKPNVTEIIGIFDSEGNEYYNVNYLTEDTVYKPIINMSYDRTLVKYNLVPKPAPYRFIKRTSLATRLSTLTFGGGNAQALDDDIIPDPSEFSLPLYGKRTFSRFTINPSNFLQSNTLGVITPNSTISIEYRHGGGLNHNSSEGTIRGLGSISMTFPNAPSPSVSQQVRKSLSVNNPSRASGGDDALSVDELKALIPSYKASQSRIVNKPDIISRIYLMPSSFGRVYRVSVRDNPNNPLASQVFIVSRNAQKQLITSPDSLKKNLEIYLNTYRMITDAVDILDARIINLKVEYSVVIDPSYNKHIVIQNINSRLKQYFSTGNFQIDQPLILSEIQNLIYNNNGVVSVTSVKFKNISNDIGNRTYSNIQYDVDVNTIKGILVGPPGSIFEIRYPEYDIEGTAV